MSRVIVWPLIGVLTLKILWPSDLYAQSFSARVVNYFKNEKTQEVPSWVIGVVGLFAGSDPDFMTTKGLHQVKNGDFVNSDEIFREVLSGNPINYEASLGRGKLALLRGDYELAESSFTKANHLKPELVETYLGLAQTMIAKGEYQKATKFINDSVAANKELSELKFLLGYISLLRGNTERVEEEILDGLRFNLSSPVGLVILANMYIENNEITLALETLNKVFEKNKAELLGYVAYADIYLSQKNYDKALESLKPITEIHSKDYDYLIRYGMAMALSGNIEEAEKAEEALAEAQFIGKKSKALEELKTNIALYRSAIKSAGGEKVSVGDSSFLKAKLLTLYEHKKAEEFVELFLGEVKKNGEGKSVAIEVFGLVLDKNEDSFTSVIDTSLYEKHKASEIVKSSLLDYINNVTLRNDEDFIKSYIEVGRELISNSSENTDPIALLKKIGERLNSIGVKNTEIYYPFMSLSRVLFIYSKDPLFSSVDNFLDSKFLKENFSIEVDQATINEYRNSNAYQRNLKLVNEKRKSIKVFNAYTDFSQQYYNIKESKPENLGEYMREWRTNLDKAGVDRNSFVYNGIMYQLASMSNNRQVQEESLNAILKNPKQFLAENDDPYIAFLSVLQGNRIEDIMTLATNLKNELVKYPDVFSPIILKISYSNQEEYAYKLLDETKASFKEAEYEKLSSIVNSNYKRYKDVVVREKVSKILPEAEKLMANKKAKEAYELYLQIIEMDEGNWLAQKQAANYEHSISDYEKANLRVSNLIVIYRDQKIKDQYLANSIFWLCVSHGINCSMHRKELTEIKIDDEILKEEALLKLIIDADDLAAARAQIAEIEAGSNLKKKLLATKYKHVIEAIEKKRAEEAKWKENPYLMPPTEEMQKQHEPSEATIVE